MPFGHGMLAHFALDPEVTYLNHGTVGVTPRRVLAAQAALRDRIESQPSRVLLREIAHLVGTPAAEPTLLRAAAGAVAAFLGARGDDLVFVDNATTGVNAVLRSLPLAPGDELLLLDHAYGAVANVAAFVARERGATVRTVAVPYPAFSPAALLDAVDAALGPRTRLALFDHITSDTALVLPVAELAARCRARGVPVLIDGAHAPGAIPVDIPALGVDWYTANLHKWAHAPRSAGFLWAAPGRQRGLHPPVISWGLDQGFQAEFDWVGTRDPTPWLAAPEGLAFLRELGIADVYAWNHRLAWQAGQLLTARWGTALGVGEADVGTMITVAVPPRLGGTRPEAARLRDALLFEDGIEVAVHATAGRLWIRVSAQIYNELADAERLATAVRERA